MPGFNGTGPRGTGPMTGGGRGYCIVLLPEISPANRGGMAYGANGGRWVAPYFGIAPGVTAEEELNFLRNRTQALKGYLQEVDARIQKLTTEKK